MNDQLTKGLVALRFRLRLGRLYKTREAFDKAVADPGQNQLSRPSWMLTQRLRESNKGVEAAVESHRISPLEVDMSRTDGQVCKHS